MPWPWPEILSYEDFFGVVFKPSCVVFHFLTIPIQGIPKLPWQTSLVDCMIQKMLKVVIGKIPFKGVSVP